MNILSLNCNRLLGPSISIILFMIGLVTSRAGLWMYDLSTTQLFQEHVVEAERGIVGGVQDAFNNILDLIQFILVLILPGIQTFWILILVSISFIVLSLSTYITFVIKVKFGATLHACVVNDSDLGIETKEASVTGNQDGNVSSTIIDVRKRGSKDIVKVKITTV